MRRLKTAICLPLLGQFVLAIPAVRAQSGADEFTTKVRPVLEQNCFACHGSETQTQGIDFSAFKDGAAAAAKPDLWRKVREKLDAHLMPPPPMPGLSAADAAAVIRWIDSIAGPPKTISTSSGAGDPGRVTARRLNRVEFNNTVRDLLGVAVRPADDFPIDNQGYGFDNNGDVLTLSPMLMEKYMSAARSISRVAVYGEPYEKTPGIVGKLLVKSVQDDGQVSGNTIGFSIRGALDGTFRFPVEADYVLQFRVSNRRGRSPGAALRPVGQGGRGASGGRGAGRDGAAQAVTPERMAAIREAQRLAAPPVEFDIDVDGKQVHKEMIEGEEAYTYTRGPITARIHVTAGEHRIEAYFPDNAKLDNPRTNLNPDGRRRLGGEFVEILGPYSPDPGHAASYSKIFICATQDAVCTRKIVESLERRGYRRPPTDAETQKLLKLVALVRKQGDSFAEAIRVAVQAVLVSPSFLFRVEHDHAPGASAYRLNDYELASRLSYFLWSSMPDDELLKMAAQHRLGDPSVRAAEIKRMLRDAKASNLVDDFAFQWLDIRALDRKKPDAVKFPMLDDEILGDMRRETQLFVGEIFHEDRSLLDLIDGKFTYLNGPLAHYYGIPGPNAYAFERVSLEGTQRGGILTQGSILALTSFATRTSPVIRGKWVLENLLGAPPPPPPPDVPALEATNLGPDASIRTRMEQHRANPACAVCHKQMDPIGFGLENFDAAGNFRAKDGKFDVDSSGILPDGRTFTGVAGLRGILRSQSDQFTHTLTAKMLTFALGRGLEPSDRATVDQINQKLIAGGNKLSVLVSAIVESEPFLMREPQELAKK
ncbi:MAG TPA: DUF1592 domain-containing protein [Bryobacteraceae bacterium]